jgi:cytoskeletal protein CcmA (bactofilin family)
MKAASSHAPAQPPQRRAPPPIPQTAAGPAPQAAVSPQAAGQAAPAGPPGHDAGWSAPPPPDGSAGPSGGESLERHRRKTLVDAGTQLKGSLFSDCPIEIKGRVEGDLTAPALVVSETGAIQGNVKVGELHSQGELAGNIDADVVKLSGKVKGETVVQAKSLEMKLASRDGKIQLVFRHNQE